ncbi:membrane protein [Haematobacter massiliensis]|uniref:Membrane protein n=1 Tax=Haematobacter massiliensis TaxID=195105 RepID=A0A086Y863_9RHOB|nr:OmpA family protein [Haematobacter massiliensis]KFI30463.1 membrane protein [Haematobacter massiliensis]
MRGSRLLPPLLALLIGALPLAAAPDLGLPPEAVLTVDSHGTMGSYALPTGPADGSLPIRLLEGVVTRQVWRVPQPGFSTFEALAAMAERLSAAGYRIGFTCETLACGGFDFRYATDVAPEPEMHVDLGDFRFAVAEGASGIVTLFISRSSDSGFVQMTHVAPQSVTPAPAPAPASKPIPPEGVPQGEIAERLAAGFAVPLEDLRFTSGSATLEGGNFASLDTLAAWLGGNAARRVTLVGHTDNSGALEANRALSLRRAEAARNYLTSKGVNGRQVRAEGVGWLAPRDSNTTEAGRLRNRRVEAMAE